MERIEVECKSPISGRIYTEAFIGRWLIEPRPSKGLEPCYEWGVALTKRGRIALYVIDGKHNLRSLLDFDDFEHTEAPRDILEHAQAALGDERIVIERDI